MYYPNDTECVCFVSRRRNTLASIASTLIGTRTNEYSVYTNQPMEKFRIIKEEFVNCFWFYKCFYHAIDHANFSKVIDVWYESMIDDPKYLFGLMGIDRDMRYDSTPSPYKYQELVVNIDECCQWLDFLEKQPVTETLIQNFKSNIKSDLQSIQQ